MPDDLATLRDEMRDVLANKWERVMSVSTEQEPASSLLVVLSVGPDLEEDQAFRIILQPF